MRYQQLTIDFNAPAPPASPEAAPQRPADTSDRRLFFMSLASGSSGNSSYVGTARGGIIIDVGIRAELIAERLQQNGIAMGHVKGVLITHDHSDHIRYAYTLLRKYKHLHLFCTPRVLAGMLRRHNISRRITDYHRPIYKEIPFSISDFTITAFDVPHDGSDNCGFSIEYDGRRLVVATDLGEITERPRHYMQQADYLVIESNYDADMLRLGPYPMHLKARIATSHGHMDNRDTAAYLAALAPTSPLSHVMLCHLSADNNTPELALSATVGALRAAGLSVGPTSLPDGPDAPRIRIMTLPRHDASPLMVWRPKAE